MSKSVKLYQCLSGVVSTAKVLNPTTPKAVAVEMINEHSVIIPSYLIDITSSAYGHIPKLFFRDADDFDSKTPSSNVEGVKKLVNVVLW